MAILQNLSYTLSRRRSENLISSLRSGNAKKAQQLLKRYPELATCSIGSYTPLEIAIEKNFTEVAELLIANGADVNTKDKHGVSLLHQAATHGHTRSTELLITGGADVNAKDKFGNSLLHMVDVPKIAELLIAGGADVNARDRFGNTPLHRAADESLLDRFTEVLIAKGAEINAKNDDGNTPLHIARTHSRHKIADLLIAKGANVKAKNKSGYTPKEEALQAVRRVIANEEIDRIVRWKASGEPEAWVRKHPHGWNHNDWLALLDSLRKSEYWPMDEAAIGQHLEMLQDGETRQAKRVSVPYQNTNDVTEFARRRGGVILDATTEEYKQNYFSGAIGEQLPDGAEEVVELIIQACRWGDQNGNPWPLDRYPQYARIRELGDQINRVGGIQAMQRVGAFVDVRTRQVAGSLTLLNNFWDGVGKWLA